MRIPKFKLYRMGSDPEALFVKPVDFDFIITPAYAIMGQDKKKTTSSFIGTDNRPVIAEIRPNPSRNLKRHLYEIAYAVCSMQDYLDNSPKWNGLKLIAYPHLLNENLGGHIHASMFLNDPLYLKAETDGYTLGASGSILAQIPGREPGGRNRDLESEVHSALNSYAVYTPYYWGQTMNHLLGPFERWVQPWVAREARNAHYGSETGMDVVRLGTSKPPFVKHGYAYVHWEYRLPSTWLQHPWLAYAYLGLAKLTLLNMERVATVWARDYPFGKKGVQPTGEAPLSAPTQFTVLSPGDPYKAGTLLKQRLAELDTPKLRVSRDLAHLKTAVENCATSRGRWFAKPQPIDIDAWRKML